MTDADGDYTLTDHEFRDDDLYALGKYRLTARWLRKSAARGVLYNIGCGAGSFNRMATDLGFVVRAFEPDAAAFALAEADCPSGCEVRMLGLEDIPGDHDADVIVMHDVLEHIADDRTAVARLAEVARPGARLILSVPAMPSLFGFHDEQLGHHRRYTSRSLRSVLATRVEVQRLRYYGTTMIPVTFWYSRHKRRPYPTASAASGGMTTRVLRALCALEERLPGPIGTSLLCRGRVRA